MKTIQNILSIVVLIALLNSCQLNTDMKQMLSKPDSRKEMMDSIANNSNMAKEMINALMSSKKGVVIMHDNQKAMMKIHESNIKMLPAIKENSLTMNMAMVN